MGSRLQSDVSAGLAGKKGGVPNAPSAEPEQVNDMNPLGAHLQANFAAVKGGAKAGGSKHAGAPDGGNGGGSMPGGTPLQGHFFQRSNDARGKSPQRGPGRKTPSNPTDVS